MGAFVSFAVYPDEGGCLVKGKCFRSQRKNESPHEMKVSILQAIQIIYIVTVMFVHIYAKDIPVINRLIDTKKGGQCRACVNVLNLYTDF